MCNIPFPIGGTILYFFGNSQLDRLVGRLIRNCDPELNYPCY